MSPLAAAAPPGPVLAPDDPPPAAARLVFLFHLQRFHEHEATARAGDVEGIHQLRVATRRLRAALRLFGPVLAKTFVASAERDLAWMAAAIGQVRDLDVLAQELHVRATRLTPESRRALGPLGLTMHDERQRRHAALLAVLDSPRRRRLVDRLAAFGTPRAEATGPPLAAVVPDLMRPLLRAFRRAGRGLDADAPPESLHRLRVRAKRVRYALETVRDLGGKSMQRTIRRLTRLQEVLGDCQDDFMAIAWLRRYAETAGVPPATLVATGGLIELLARRTGKLRGRVPGLWSEFDRRRVRAELLAELAATRRGPRRVRPPVPPLERTAS